MPDNGNDRCVCCGKDSGVPHETPIVDRKYYVQGSGQLCGECYIELYVHKSEDEHVVSLDEMHELIRMCKKDDRKE